MIIEVCENLNAQGGKGLVGSKSLSKHLSTRIYKLLVSTSQIAPTVERTVIEVESTTEHNSKRGWVSCVNERKPYVGL